MTPVIMLRRENVCTSTRRAFENLGAYPASDTPRCTEHDLQSLELSQYSIANADEVGKPLITLFQTYGQITSIHVYDKVVHKHPYPDNCSQASAWTMILVVFTMIDSSLGWDLGFC